MTKANPAPGSPGLDPRWAPGPKDVVGTAIGSDSNVWFTVGNGILNEVFFPNVDTPSIRDMGFLVADDHEYFSEEKTATATQGEWYRPGVPAFTITNTAHDNRYSIKKQIISDPERDSVLQNIEFSGDGLRLYLLLSPHLGGQGSDNSAKIIKHGNQTILTAERGDCCLALVCSAPLLKASAGFVGTSDGWQDLNKNKRLTQSYTEADNGNVALVAEIDLEACGSKFTTALGFSPTIEEAIITALDSLGRGFESINDNYVNGWQEWLEQLPDGLNDDQLKSLCILKCHESKTPQGGFIAGLASPWGYAHGDDDRNGYHVVWTRDMVETVGGLIAGGAKEPVLSALRFLESTQRPDGHWPQNMWIDGTAYWNGLQMDETALPILLVNLARREGVLSDSAAISFWPMVEKASSFLVMNGPVTQQDRWEEDPGYTPFTLGAEIASLLAAADLADLNNRPDTARVLRETADIWYDSIDDWIFARDTAWSQKYGVDGYYERIVPIGKDNISRFANIVHVKNVPQDDAEMPAVKLISPDALALVRFGLRSADDKRITDTVKLIDELLKVETPNGISWHRYNDDGYGEHEDGSPFDGTGIGRIWPLLTGERAHYELAAGNYDYAEKLLSDMANFANPNGLFPEQVWDSHDIPEHGLYAGKATGSATPLAWAHAEYLKLIRSLKDKKLFDQPPQTTQRYLTDNVTSPRRAWRFNNKLRKLPAGKLLRIETLSPCKVHWSADNWETTNDSDSFSTDLGINITDLPTDTLESGMTVEFTFYWPYAKHWENRNFSVEIK